GINVGIFYKSFANETSTRYRWDGWNSIQSAQEYKKASWNHFSTFLPDFPGEVVSIQSDNAGILSRNTESILYPNPANGYVNIQADKSIEVVEIYTITGQKLLTKEIGSLTARISIENLSSGVYLIRVQHAKKHKTLRLTVLK